MVEEQQMVSSPPAQAPAPETVPAPVPSTDLAPAPATIPSDVTEEKIQNQPPEKSFDESKALAVVEKPIETATNKSSSGSIDRDVRLADLSKEKRLSFIKAWEDSEKTKAENKAEKNVSDILAWERRKQASVEAQLKKIEEQLEKKKAEYAERMKNKVAAIHKEAEEKRAMVEAKRGEDLLKAEEMAAKYRAIGSIPKPTCGCF